MRFWVIGCLIVAACGVCAQTVTVGPNVRVWQNFTAQDETTVVRSSTVPNLLVAGWNDYSAPKPNVVGLGYGWSIDSGATWSRGYLSNPQPALFTAQGDPSLAAGPNGNFYFAGLGFIEQTTIHYGQSGIYVHSSSDGGKTFTAHEVVYSATADFHDKEYVAVDPANGNIYVAWNKMVSTGANQLLYSYSTNQGTSWSSPKLIVALGGSPDLVVDSSGVLYVVYTLYNSPPTTGNIKVAKIVNPATTTPTITQNQVAAFTEIGTGGKINGGIRCTVVPSIDLNRTTGKFTLTWASKISSNYDGIYFSSSSNGTSWSGAIRLDDAASKDRYFPWLAVAPNGNICAIFYDNRNDPNDKLIDVYATFSYDQGATWTPNIRVTEASSDSHLQFMGTFFGDYIGVEADQNSNFHPVWTDARPPAMEQDIWTATLYVTPPLKVKATLDSYNPGPNGYPLTLELWKNNAVVYTQAITLTADGSQTINLPPGVYDFDKVSLRGHRFVRTKVAYVAGSVHNMEMRNGDVDDNNQVDLLDVNQGLIDFGQSGLPSDLDGSGQTNLNDLTIVLLNFQLKGD